MKSIDVGTYYLAFTWSILDDRRVLFILKVAQFNDCIVVSSQD